MTIEVNNRQKAVRLSAASVRRVLSAALEGDGRKVDLSVALVGDDEIAALNERYLGRHGLTDVLAFPYDCEGDVLVGEIVANAELAEREAAGRAHGADDELMLYLVHGLLHLLGYDDHDPADARRMRRREQEILRGAGRAVEF